VIVVDASAVVLALADGGERGREARRVLADEHADDPWYAPEHLLIECAQALRGLGLSGKLKREDLAAARRALARLSVNVVPTQLLLDRVWELSDGVTAYDAAYVACAERLDAPLVTGDRKLANALGPRCAFVTV